MLSFASSVIGQIPSFPSHHHEFTQGLKQGHAQWHTQKHYLCLYAICFLHTPLWVFLLLWQKETISLPGEEEPLLIDMWIWSILCQGTLLDPKDHMCASQCHNQPCHLVSLPPYISTGFNEFAMNSYISRINNPMLHCRHL